MDKKHTQNLTFNLKMDNYYCNLECDSLERLMKEKDINFKKYFYVCSPKCKLYKTLIDDIILTEDGLKLLRCKECREEYGVEDE